MAGRQGACRAWNRKPILLEVDYPYLKSLVGTVILHNRSGVQRRTSRQHWALRWRNNGSFRFSARARERSYPENTQGSALWASLSLPSPPQPTRATTIKIPRQMRMGEAGRVRSAAARRYGGSFPPSLLEKVTHILIKSWRATRCVKLLEKQIGWAWIEKIGRYTMGARFFPLSE